MRTDQREAEAKKCKKNIRPAHVTPTQRCQCQLQRSMPIATHAETRYAPKGCKVLACPLWATFAHCCTGQVGPERVDRVQDTCPLGRSRRIRVKHAATCSAIRLCTYSADRLQHLAFSIKLYESGDPKQKKQKKKEKREHPSNPWDAVKGNLAALDPVRVNQVLPLLVHHLVRGLDRAVTDARLLGDLGRQ